MSLRLARRLTVLAIVAGLVLVCGAGVALASTDPAAAPVLPSWLASLGGASGFLALLGSVYQAGRVREQVDDHDRRICLVEGCAGSTPMVLARMEATLEGHVAISAERHGQLREEIRALQAEAHSHAPEHRGRAACRDAMSDRGG